MAGKNYVPPNMYQWTRLSFNTAELQNGWLPEEFHDLRAIGRTSGADVTWREINQPAGGGYFLVWDAAAVLDPA
jgi:hypothetical protein